MKAKSLAYGQESDPFKSKRSNTRITRNKTKKQTKEEKQKKSYPFKLNQQWHQALRVCVCESMVTRSSDDLFCTKTTTPSNQSCESIRVAQKRPHQARKRRFVFVNR